jgi:hypothetical protein
VQAGPDAGLGPVPQTPPARHPTAADRLGRHVRPGHTRAQHVDDPTQSRTVIRRQPTRVPPTPRRARREQRSATSPTAKPASQTHSEMISKALSHRRGANGARGLRTGRAGQRRGLDAGQASAASVVSSFLASTGRGQGLGVSGNARVMYAAWSCRDSRVVRTAGILALAQYVRWSSWRVASAAGCGR